jgi:hypothetical protein
MITTNTGEIEVFRLSPEIGKCYKYAEYTRREGNYPAKERYFAPTEKAIYVGELKTIATGGYGDGGWRSDTFVKYHAKTEKPIETIVHYSYEGKTTFIEEKNNDERYKVDELSILLQPYDKKGNVINVQNVTSHTNMSKVLGHNKNDTSVICCIKQFLMSNLHS